MNRIDVTLTDDQRNRANAALAALTEAQPFLIDPSAKNRAFVVKALTIAEAHPDLLPDRFSFQKSQPTAYTSESLLLTPCRRDPLRQAHRYLFSHRLIGLSIR